MKYPNSEKRLVMFPSDTLKSPPSRQRAYNLAENLQARGWRVTVVPCELTLEERQHILQVEKPHILYIQQCLHEHNLPQLYDVPRIVFDIDDALFVYPSGKNRVIECCEGSDLVICGSKFLAKFCRRYNHNTHIVWTTMAESEREYSQPSQRRRIVAWGTSSPMFYLNEGEFLAEVMIKVREKIDFEFWVYGVKDFQALQPYAHRGQQHNIDVKLLPWMSLEKYHISLENAAVGVHPISNLHPFNLGKSFGKLNSYIVSGVPIVVDRKLDYPDFFRDGENGMLAIGTEEWVEKIYQLLVNPTLRDKITTQALLDFKISLSVEVIGEKVNSLLETLL